jgi:hypothetical protein
VKNKKSEKTGQYHVYLLNLRGRRIQKRRKKEKENILIIKKRNLKIIL